MRRERIRYSEIVPVARNTTFSTQRNIPNYNATPLPRNLTGLGGVVLVIIPLLFCVALALFAVSNMSSCPGARGGECSEERCR